MTVGVVSMVVVVAGMHVIVFPIACRVHGAGAAIGSARCSLNDHSIVVSGQLVLLALGTLEEAL